MKKLFFIIVVFYSVSYHGQQTLLYSNYLENSFYLNPAVAHLGKKSLNIIYRNQWAGFEGAPKTTFLSYPHFQMLVDFFKMRILEPLEVLKLIFLTVILFF